MNKDILPESVIRSSEAFGFSNALAGEDGLIGIYLQAAAGSVLVRGGFAGAQWIYSAGISDEDQSFIHSVIRRLDDIIDLDFAFVQSSDLADIVIYYDTKIELGGDERVLGLAVMTSGGWEIFINYPEVANDEEYRKYVNVHEIGHALGLEHPFDDSDGDLYSGTTDPWASAFPEQTVMAYREPVAGVWPDFFTLSDLNVLTDDWGVEHRWLTDAHDEFAGQAYDEIVTGLGGHDRIYTLGGDDWIDGGLGDDLIWGGDGADVFRLSQGFDWIVDFSYGEGDRIEFPSDLAYTLTEVNGNLQISSSLGVTSLTAVTASQFPFEARIPV